MSKPRTQEVDYFPHYCDHGKVLFILETNFQNDGYAVFYKIHELLAKTNGHCYDASSVEGWEYLLSKMNTPEDRVVAIIEKLVAMNTLDSGLWKYRLLWMQTFIDSIADAYSRRKVNLPVKPDIPSISNPLSGTNVDILPTDRVVSGTNVDIYPQSKEKKSKEKKTYLVGSQEIRLSERLLGRILGNNQNYKKPDIQAWAKEVDLMIRIDKRTPEDIEKVIDFCQTDGFWQANILSTAKLREQFDKLWMQMKRRVNGKTGRDNKTAGAESDDREYPVDAQYGDA